MRSSVMRGSVLIWFVAVAGMVSAARPYAAHASTNLNYVQRMSDGIADVAAMVKPGVVAIVAEGTRTVTMRSPFDQFPFERFFRPPGGRDPQPEEREMPHSGQGSGVIVAHGGDTYILTNYHVVQGADRIRVQLADDRYFEAEIAGTDSLSDLAMLTVNADDLPVVQLGRSVDLRDAEMVLAIGNPLGYAHSITLGIISARGRGRFSPVEYGYYIQTDAAINPGNSGGPLVNLKGEIIGINTAIVTRTGGYQGIGFAIPVDMVRDVMTQLIEHGTVRRGLLGAIIGDIDALTAEALGMRDTRGVMINSVSPGGPAEVAGVKGGDVVLAVDDDRVRNATELKAVIGATPPGSRVDLLILRDGEEKTISVELAELTEEALAGTDPVRAPSGEARLGLEVQALTPEIARRMGVDDDEGVIVASVRSGSEAGRRGIRRGDIIREINRQRIRDMSDYADALDKVEPGDAVLMLIVRGDSTRYVGLRMPRE